MAAQYLRKAIASGGTVVPRCLAPFVLRTDSGGGSMWNVRLSHMVAEHLLLMESSSDPAVLHAGLRCLRDKHRRAWLPLFRTDERAGLRCSSAYEIVTARFWMGLARKFCSTQYLAQHYRSFPPDDPSVAEAIAVTSVELAMIRLARTNLCAQHPVRFAQQVGDLAMSVMQRDATALDTVCLVTQLAATAALALADAGLYPDDAIAGVFPKERLMEWASRNPLSTTRGCPVRLVPFARCVGVDHRNIDGDATYWLSGNTAVTRKHIRAVIHLFCELGKEADVACRRARNSMPHRTAPDGRSRFMDDHALCARDGAYGDCWGDDVPGTTSVLAYKMLNASEWHYDNDPDAITHQQWAEWLRCLLIALSPFSCFYNTVMDSYAGVPWPHAGMWLERDRQLRRLRQFVGRYEEKYAGPPGALEELKRENKLFDTAWLDGPGQRLWPFHA